MMRKQTWYLLVGGVGGYAVGRWDWHNVYYWLLGTGLALVLLALDWWYGRREKGGLWTIGSFGKRERG